MPKSAYGVAERLRNEFVVRMTGTVRARPEGMANPNMPTGEIEVLASTRRDPEPVQAVPIAVDDDGYRTDESLRLKYRYLDLRRERLQKNMILRHKTIKFIRDYLDEQGFLEIETPMLIKSTPEGARDYVVPSRVQPGKFYALPQSPQQLKQLLMVAGYERYFQIARCLRDEDLRGDRQPEFTQLDLEMSFVERDDVLAVVEGLITGLVPGGHAAQADLHPVPEAHLRRGDGALRHRQARPALRHGAGRPHRQCSRIRSSRSSPRLRGAGGLIKGIRAPGCAAYSRKDLDELTESGKGLGRARAWRRWPGRPRA